ncbi:MAG TPA: M20/M25/M40 family metallo-hydrolase [Desulfobacteria bacterium]|nr:M20/M25/M40 family metallo-hydrolase [Desulfobacteria bacterium]
MLIFRVFAAKSFGLEAEPKGVYFYTDASVFTTATGGTLPTVIWGPGNVQLMHQPNEYVEIDKYLRAISFYAEVARRYLA